jgi:tol-pal system protein YbgF
MFRIAPLLFLLASGACATTAPDAEVTRLAETVAELQRRVGKQSSRIEELSNQVFVLSDRVDSARVEADRAPEPPPLKVVHLVPEARRPDPDPAPPPETEGAVATIRLGDDGEPTAVPVVPVKPPRRATKAPGAERAFRDALAAYRQAKVEVAYKRFARFLREHPRHPYADNARYWMGECRYDAKEYRKAAQEFSAVIEGFPRSNKIPDALLKLGLAYEKLGQAAQARQAFSDLVAGYPRSALADLARAHLEAEGFTGGSQ